MHLSRAYTLLGDTSDAPVNGGITVAVVARGERMVVVDRVFTVLGAAHKGSVGVLPNDGTEPGPVHFDVGSGPNMPSSPEWHAYDGRHGRPQKGGEEPGRHGPGGTGNRRADEDAGGNAKLASRHRLRRIRCRCRCRSPRRH